MAGSAPESMSFKCGLISNENLHPRTAGRPCVLPARCAPKLGVSWGHALMHFCTDPPSRDSSTVSNALADGASRTLRFLQPALINCSVMAHRLLLALPTFPQEMHFKFVFLSLFSFAQESFIFNSLTPVYFVSGFDSWTSLWGVLVEGNIYISQDLSKKRQSRQGI